MATTVKQQAFLATLEYVLDGERKHFVHPMKLKHLSKIQELFTHFNDDLIILNMPTVLADDQGIPVLSEEGEEIIDDSAYSAMMEVLELALNDTKENIESWIGIGQIEEVLAKYRRVSGLLDKKKQMEAQILNGTSL